MNFECDLLIPNSGYRIDYDYDNLKSKVYSYINFDNPNSQSYAKKIMQVTYTEDLRVWWDINWDAIDKDLIEQVLKILPNKISIKLISFNKMSERAGKLLLALLNNFFIKDERSATQGNSFSIYPSSDLKHVEVFK